MKITFLGRDDMELRIKYEFDPIFETVSLLYGSAQKVDKEKTVELINAFGVDGEKFYKKYYKVSERYVRCFKKYMVKNEHFDFFFREEEEEFLLFLTVLLVENRDWFQDFTHATDLEIRSLAAEILQDEGTEHNPLERKLRTRLQEEKEVIRFLSNLELEDGLKWHLMEFLEQPVQWLSILLDLVKANIPAFEQALSDMEKPLETFMTAYKKYEDQQFREIADACAPGAVVYPSLAAGSSQVICYTQAYQGIFVQYLIKKGTSLDEKKERLIARMKALSDKSKLDILCHLKRSSKYNLELAESMNLSPSTMSHHMNVLFACEFVGVEKKDGRVYYVLKEDAVREFVDSIGEFLL